MSESSQQTPNQERAEDKTKGDKQPINWKVFFIIIAAFSLVLWQVAERFNGFLGSLFHWASVCGFLADGAYAAHKSVKRIKSKKRIWVSFCALSIIVGMVYFRKPNGDESPSPIANPKAWQPPELPKDWEVIHLLVAGGDLPVTRSDVANGKTNYYGFAGINIVYTYVKNNRAYIQVPLEFRTNAVSILMSD